MSRGSLVCYKALHPVGGERRLKGGFDFFVQPPAKATIVFLETLVSATTLSAGSQR